MNKFTSGEWVVDESRHDGCINRLEPFRHIGMVSAYQAVAGDREENEANARLIAAAPDLLEALQHMLMNANGRDLSQDESGALDLAISMAESAIKKATTIQ